MSDVVIPIVFPDYKITVDIPKEDYDPIPYFNFDNFSTPAYKERFSNLGHAGVLFINGQTGSTKYFEYGRYDPPKYLGKIRKIMNLPNVTISNEKINLQSLKRTLYVISSKSGHNTRIQGVYIEVPNKFEAMLGYARLRKQQNTNPHRKPYSILSYSCVHFTKEVTQKAGVSTPWIIDPRPNSYIGEFRDDFIDLDFDFHKNQLKIEGKGIF